MISIAPWEAILTDAQHSIILFFLVLAGLAIFAQFIRSCFFGPSLSERYRPAAVAGVAVTGVAFFAYVLLIVSFFVGYAEVGDHWIPNSVAEWSFAARYAEWAIDVPLLLIQLFTVAAFTTRKYIGLKILAVVSAFLMILTGYLGGVVVSGGHSLGALWSWGLVSTVFFVVVFIIVIYTTIRTMNDISDKAKVMYRNAMVLLLITWMVYPAVFGFQGFTQGGVWTMVAQIALCVADVAAKVGFGTLLFFVAKQRTEDDRSDSTHQTGSVQPIS